MTAVTLYCAKISGKVALRRVTVPRIDDGLLPPASNEINDVISADDSESTLSMKMVVVPVELALLSAILPLPGSASDVALVNL